MEITHVLLVIGSLIGFWGGYTITQRMSMKYWIIGVFACCLITAFSYWKGVNIPTAADVVFPYFDLRFHRKTFAMAYCCLFICLGALLRLCVDKENQGVRLD